MSYFVTLILTIIYVALLNIYFDMFVSKRNIGKTKSSLLLLFMIFLNGVISFFLVDKIIIKQILVICFNACIIWRIYEIDLNKSFLLVLIFHGSEMTLEYLVFVIMQYVFRLKVEELLKNDFKSDILGLFCYLVFFFVISISGKTIPKKKADMLSKTEWVRFSIFPLFSLITILILLFKIDYVENDNLGTILFWICSGLILMNVLMFCLLKDAIRKENELAEYRLARERGKNETEMYYSSIQHFEEQCKMIHEFRNHLHCISMLAKHNEIMKLNDYISKIQDNTISNQDVINTNHQIINRILNSKYHEACKKNILMIFKLSDLSEITIEDQDLVILLSNLINNAFEACEQCENKVIKIKIEKSDFLVISILNTFNLNYS